MNADPKRVWLAALGLGWLMDYLFWKKAWGVSFPVFVGLAAAAGVGLLYLEGRRLQRRNLVLLALVGGFGLFSMLRLEPLSRFLAFGLTLTGMILLAVSATGGRWPSYGWADYVVKPIRLAVGMVANGTVSIAAVRRQRREAGRQMASPRLRAAGRGVLLALPILAVFTALLASADLIFAQQLGALAEKFRLERLGEYLARLGLILAAAYALAGALIQAIEKSGDERLVGENRPASRPPLGFSESAVVLGSVVVLFGIFIGFQLKYFFSGEANIALEGFTYAQYARRGFGELILTATLSLGLFLGLSGLTRRETPTQRRAFSALGVGLTASVGLILASAFQRLLLYESTYGFSRLRLYPHVFMIWLGLLLAAAAGLEIAGRLRLFPTALLLAAAGFGLTLNAINVDGLIARRNLERAALGFELDTTYLANLSLDAAPELARQVSTVGLPTGVRDGAGAALACMANLNGMTWNVEAVKLKPAEARPWQAFHLGRWNGEQWIRSVVGELEGYRYERRALGYPPVVISPTGTTYRCSTGRVD